MRVKGKFTKYLMPVFGILAALFLSTPSVAFAAENGDGPATDTTDVKIIDSMPIIYSDSDLNASLAVLDMSTGEPVNLHQQTVPAGTVLTYVIAYRNDNETTETVHMQIPVLDDYPLRSKFTDGTYEGTIVSWDGVTVEPGETVTRYITCDTPHATSMLPNTGLVSMPGKSLTTNTVEVAVSAPAVVENPAPVIETTPQPTDTGVLGAMRRALKAAEDSPAVLGMRRAVQTGDVGYIIPRVLLLAVICVGIASLIVIAFKRKGESR